MKRARPFQLSEWEGTAVSVLTLSGKWFRGCLKSSTDAGILIALQRNSEEEDEFFLPLQSVELISQAFSPRVGDVPINRL